MKTIYVFLAEGFEEVEALTPVDVLRRAGLPVKTVSVTGVLTVNGAHGVPVIADMVFEEVKEADTEMIVLPGGLPGATNLDAHKGLSDLIMAFAEAGKPLSAICAAPLVYGKRGLLKGKKATCYPGFDKYLDGADYTAALVQNDGKNDCDRCILCAGDGHLTIQRLAAVDYILCQSTYSSLSLGAEISAFFSEYCILCQRMTVRADPLCRQLRQRLNPFA